MKEEIQKRKNAILGLREEIFTLLHSSQEKQEEKELGIKDLVTEVDIKIDDLLRGIIEEFFPEDNIVSEESDPKDVGGRFTWYLDAIDGTTNFVHKLGDYGTSVGLVCDEEIVLGIIFYAAEEKVYWAIAGEGAYAGVGDKECDQKLCVSKKNTLKECVFSFLLHYDPTLAEKDFFVLKELAPDFRGIRMYGDMISNFIRIAKGETDAFWAQDYGEPYDFCAGVLIVKEAGGFVSGYDTELFIPVKVGPIFATNLGIHKAFVERISSLEKKFDETVFVEGEGSAEGGGEDIDKLDRLDKEVDEVLEEVHTLE